MINEKLLPLREVERRLGLTRWTLYNLIRSGKLPAVKLTSGHYRVREDAVLAMCEGGHAPRTPGGV